MAQIAGRLQAGVSFTLEYQSQDDGVVLTLWLNPDKRGAHFSTDPLKIRASVFNEWRRTKQVPTRNPDDKTH
jgi:hypothetical protein